MLNELVKKLITARSQEQKAKENRIAVEEKIIEIIEKPENGSTTIAAGKGLKITVTTGSTYKADVEAIRNLDIAEEVMPVKLFPAEYKFDAKEYERIISDHPDIAAKLGKFVVVTPKKVSVTPKIG